MAVRCWPCCRTQWRSREARLVLVSQTLRGCCWGLARCWRGRCFEERKAFQLAASRVKWTARALLIAPTSVRFVPRVMTATVMGIVVHSPTLRASRSDLPFSISSSSRRYLSLSSRSLFSESSRTDFRNAAGSRSSGVSVVLLSPSCGASNGGCWEVGEPVGGLGRGGAACSILLVAIINNNNTAVTAAAAGIRPRENEQPAARGATVRVG